MSALNHELAGRIAAANEFKRNPDKSWPCRARNVCGVCGEMMEVGQMVSAHLRPGGRLRHSECGK